MKRFLSTLLLGLAVLLALPQEAQAQNRPLRSVEIQALTADTATNAETINFAVPRYADGIGSISWQIEAINLSGTTGGTATLQYSNDQASAQWHDAASWAFSGTSDTLFSVPTFTAARFRVSVTTSGTQSTRFLNFIKWVKRE